MSDKKLVSLNHLDNFRFLLLTVKSRKSLIEYFDKYILELEKQDINELKRVIYSLMKSYKELDEEKYNQYYILYQNIKNGMDYKTALEVLNSFK